MITEEDYLKAKQIIQEYEKQLNISVVIQQSEQICDLFVETDDILNHEFICKNCGMSKWVHKSHICV
jgi:hypothetical protein